MDWIASTGGPLILVPKCTIHDWHGVTGEFDETDYDRACKVNDFCGILECRGYQILVLGDEPLDTAIWQAGNTPMLVRWMYAPSEAAIINCLSSLKLDSPAEVISWHSQDNEYLLFDSSAEGNAILKFITLNLRLGQYVIRTYLLKPTGDIGILLHVFDFCDEP